jgi:hypothetical protein
MRPFIKDKYNTERCTIVKTHFLEKEKFCFHYDETSFLFIQNYRWDSRWRRLRIPYQNNIPLISISDI